MIKNKKISDRFYSLFHEYLLNYSFENSDEFTEKLVEGYLQYLDSQMYFTPPKHKKAFVEDLKHEARKLLMRRLYGGVSLEEILSPSFLLEKKPTKPPSSHTLTSICHEKIVKKRSTSKKQKKSA